MRRMIVAIVCLAFSGCGPTPQERYNTALSILDREQKAMNALEGLAENAQEDATKATYRVFTARTLKTWS